MRELSASLLSLLDQEFTPEGWDARGRRAPMEGGPDTPEDGAPVRVAVRSVPTEQIVPVAPGKGETDGEILFEPSPPPSAS